MAQNDLWSFSNDSFLPMAKELRYYTFNLDPGPIDFEKTLRKYEFPRALMHLKVIVSVDVANDLEKEVLEILNRINHLNSVAWKLLLREWGPLADDAPEHEEYNRAAWIFSDRWVRYVMKSDPDNYKPAPPELTVMAKAYRDWIDKVRQLWHNLIQISEAVQIKFEVVNRNLDQTVRTPRGGIRKKTGRPPVRNNKLENQIMNLWGGGKGRYESHRDLDRELGLDLGETKKILDKLRKRNERRRRATDETDETNADSGEQRK
jgi:hypothetical protein